MHQPALENYPHSTFGEHLLFFAQWRERLIASEQGDGWIAECVDEGRFLAVNRELVDALSLTLRQLAGNGPVLEVCAGSGELARALTAAGLDLDATDVEPAARSEVLRLSAESALRNFRPSVVLGAFVPIDAGVDEAVLACPTVKHYVVLNARIGVALGSSTLWQASEWRAEPLEAVRPWMLTRHDVWMGSLDRASSPTGNLLQHGEAWLFSRTSLAPPTERAC